MQAIFGEIPRLLRLATLHFLNLINGFITVG